MALIQCRALSLCISVALGLASVLCLLAVQDGLQKFLLRQPSVVLNAWVPEGAQNEPDIEEDWLNDAQRPRPIEEPLLDDTESEGNGSRAAESPSRQPAAAGAEFSRPTEEPSLDDTEPGDDGDESPSRPMQKPSLDDQKPEGAGLRAAESPSRKPAAAGAKSSRSPRVQTLPPVPIRKAGTCGARCKWQGYDRTCRQHMQWLADHQFPDVPKGCFLAYSKIRNECPSCSGCQFRSIGCTVPCNRSCTLGRQAATCAAHMQRLALQVSRKPSGPPDACKAASARVSEACPSCSMCRPRSAGCILPCERQCNLRSVTASCRSHIQWLVDHDFSKRQDACDAAHERVLSKCPSCSSCALSATGCKRFQETSVQKKLLQRIYGIRAPSPLKELPSCAKKLQIFVYDISSAYNADLIASVHKRRVYSNCDYEVTDCQEKRWDTDYSVLRSLAGEVVLLMKFLSMPQITDDAEKADLFVVPWFGALDKIEMDQPWAGGDSRVHRRTMEVITQLPHMRNPDKARRHVFFSTIDHDDVDTTLLSQARAGALLLHYGPSAGPREVVVVPSGAGFGAPLEPLPHPAPNFLFYMAGAVNVHRRRMDSELSRLQAIRPDLKIMHHTVEGHRKLALTPAETHLAMSRSLLCPIAQGDLPFQHRFFDALVSGCIPVVIKYSKPGKCHTWSWIYTEGPWGKWPRPCVNRTYPLASSLRYDDVVVQIRASKFKDGGGFAEALAKLDMGELNRKRRRLEGLRHLFVYDRTGKTHDAFSGLLQELCNRVGAG